MIYKSISQKFRDQFYKYVTTADKILITSHIAPDDDAVGSSLALQHLIKLIGSHNKVDVAFSGFPSDRFSCFEGYSKISFNQDISEITKNYKLLIFLDGNEYSRFSLFPDRLKASNAPKICIDHHSSRADTFTIAAKVPNATSTAELIYKLSSTKKSLNREFYESILLGILGDTGTFNYIKPGQYHIFDIVRKILKSTQINIQEFKSRYMYINPESFEIIRELMKNAQFLHVDNWPDFQISFITREYIKNNNFSDPIISEGSDIFVSQYIRQVKGSSWGFVIRPHTDGSCRLSFRSLPGSVNVRDLVERMVIGGGHDRASGAKISEPDPQKTLQLITDWMKTNTPVLV